MRRLIQHEVVRKGLLEEQVPELSLPKGRP